MSWTNPTAGELLRELKQKGDQPCEFFTDYADVVTRKCYGIRTFTAELIEADRALGFYGRREVTFTEPFLVMRGHRLVRFPASKQRPVKTWETLFPSI